MVALFRHSVAVLALTLATLLAPTAAHADKSYAGSGDHVLRIRPTESPGLLTLKHTGESNFIVTTVNSSGKQEELLGQRDRAVQGHSHLQRRRLQQERRRDPDQGRRRMEGRLQALEQGPLLVLRDASRHR
jgi:hypothetical protein